MSKNSRQKDRAKVTIIYLDGGHREFIVSAGPTIGLWLATRAGETGMLHLFNDESSLTIPIAGVVREWLVTPIEEPTNE